MEHQEELLLHVQLDSTVQPEQLLVHLLNFKLLLEVTLTSLGLLVNMIINLVDLVITVQQDQLLQLLVLLELIQIF